MRAAFRLAVPIAAARALEAARKLPAPSILYDGEPEDLARLLGAASSVPFAVLLDTAGRPLAAAEGFDDLGGLEAVLRERLGSPPVALSISARTRG